jgi:uncharacterized protein YqgV (UPF0045/DUF77 family)
MRTLGKVAACEISFLPMQSCDGASYVNKVIELIDKSGLEHNVGAMSTFVRGDKDKVFKLLKKIYTYMDEKCSFVITAKISNLCGCNMDTE